MYKLTFNGVLRLSDNSLIPVDEGNTDYQEYRVWVDQGNTPLPADVPDRKAIIQAQIDTIERATMVPRLVREGLMRAAERAAQEDSDKLTAAGTPTTAAGILATNIGYCKAKQVDDQIKQLRSQII